MSLFKRKDKDPIVSFEVQFEEGGRTYPYGGPEDHFRQRMDQRGGGLVREAPHSIVAIRQSDKREPYTL